MNLLARIDHWAQTTPDQIAHVCGSDRLTYRELCKRSDALAAELARRLPGDRSPVVVLGHKEPELVVAFLACVKAGHPYVPLDTALPERRVATIVDSAGAQLILTPNVIRELISQAQALEPTASRPDWRPLAQEDPFYVIYTSGSTGTPKGVVITLGCLNSFMDWMLCEHALVDRDETFLGIVPFSFDVSIMDLYLSLYCGGTHYSITRDEIGNPAQLFPALSRSNATVWISTPSFAQMCLVERSFTARMLPRLRRIVLAGEVLSRDLASELLNRFPGAQLWNGYGPTEATVLTTSVQVDRSLIERYASIPIGYPRPEGRVFVVDDDGLPTAEGERGEIVIAGRHVSPGYLNRPDLTAKAFFTLEGLRAYRTGDWGRARDGLLFFEGRRDNQIKLHGYRIELGDVEENLLALEGVRDAVVLPRLHGGQPERLVAFVILSHKPQGGDFQTSLALRNQLAGRLPAYMLPQSFRFVATFPMTVNGKADRQKLAEMID